MEDYLPISMLNQLEYCERRFYLMYVMGEMEVNVHVLEGTFLHESTHTPGRESEDGIITHRKVQIWSDRLRILGFADVVQEIPSQDEHLPQESQNASPQSVAEMGDGNGKNLCLQYDEKPSQPDQQSRGEGIKRLSRLVPIEYKKGRMGKWLNDHIQLCAQAMCLEERSGLVVETGFIFYFGSRRREQVAFTPELRQRTEAAIRRAFEIAESPTLPPPLDQYTKCRDCSLEPICLPREVRTLNQRSKIYLKATIEP